jgi:Tol biopolymer transport system component
MGERTRMALHQGSLALALTIPLVAGLGCGGEDLAAPTTGILQITTTTSGPGPAAESYVIRIDDGAQTVIGANATLQREDVAPGDHAVELLGLPDNCAVEGQNPRTIAVAAGQTATLGFAITCSEVLGAIRVSVATSGGPTDPDGYVATLDGAEPGIPLGANGSVSFTGLTAGSHTVALTGVAANCGVDGGPSREVTVTAGATSDIGFVVTCAQPKGGIQVTTTTTGSPPDPDGYAVSVDGGGPVAIGANGTVALDGFALGPHTVLLSSLAANCHVDGDNPRSVDVVAGSTGVAFQVSCLGADALIAFTSNAFQLLAIFVVAPDGSGLRNLTPDGLFESDPVWSPDGRKILLVRDGDLYVMNADGTGRVGVADGEKISEHRWSHDGRLIAYVDLRQEGDEAFDDLWVMQADGTGKVKVAEQAFNFSWSPDGRLVYTSVADFGDVHLRIINADGSGDRRLTSRAAFQPAWSPDGSRIAFVTLGGKDIFLIDPDGGHEVNLTQGLSEDEEPTWSPDGSRIAFTLGPIDQSLESEIAVMNRDGGGRTVLTNHPGFDFQPAWSPDGTKIVFTRSEASGDDEIYVMNADGSAQTDVSRRPETIETTPNWNGRGGTGMVAGRQASFYQSWLRANHRISSQLDQARGTRGR